MMNKKALRKGFTLIELLIVIVIIGVLATTVLSAINPIEQIKKAGDAGLRSDSAEVLNALERYYTAFQDYPWERTTMTNPPYPGAVGVPLADASGTPEAWLTDTTYGLIAVDELKDEFTARENLQELYAFWDGAAGGTDLIRVCFNPQSQTNQNQAVWTATGQTGCTDTTGGCYQCVPE